MPLTCAILVLNYNGLAHLRTLLPSLEDACRHVGVRLPTIVVDNRSTDPDVHLLAQEFPDVEVIAAERNDFLFSLNSIVSRRSEDVIVILNNDMRVAADFLLPLLQHFVDDRVFAVSAELFTWKGKRYGGQILLHTDAFSFRYSRNCAHGTATYSYCAFGGAAAFRRAHFVALGGFDRAFWPGYNEDLDLTYRAWARGWRTIHEPHSVIYHRVGATFPTRARKGKQRALVARNGALFALRNLRGYTYFVGFIVGLPFRAVYYLVCGQRHRALGLLSVVPCLPNALVARWRLRQRTMSDADIRSIVHGKLERSTVFAHTAQASHEPPPFVHPTAP